MGRPNQRRGLCEHGPTTPRTNAVRGRSRLTRTWSAGRLQEEGIWAMPTITMAQATDMHTYDLFGIKDSDITQESSTQITAFDADDNETFIFTGNFGGFDPSTELPSTGAATGFVLQENGATDITITHASLPVPDFFG